MSKFTDEVEELCKQRNLLFDKKFSASRYVEYAIKLSDNTTRPAIGLQHEACYTGSAIVFFYNHSLRRYTKNIDELKYMLDVFMQSSKMYSRGLDEMWRLWHERRTNEEQQKFCREMRTNVENYEERMMRLYDLDRS